MKEYKFNNTIFVPEDAKQLTSGDKKVRLAPQMVKLLTYFVENPRKNQTRDSIIAAVWGPGEHTYSALNKAVHSLNEVLPPDCRVSTVYRVGYNFDHHVICTTPKFDKVERHFKHSPAFKRYLNVFIALACIGIVINLGMAFTHFYFKKYPPASFQVDNKEVAFTRDHLVDTPQLSPDGRYIAHKLSKNAFVDDYLGLYDYEWDDTTPLVPMGFYSGYKWNIAGDKIVYQNLTDDSCEIRLLHLNTDKSINNNQFLRGCEVSDGKLSFAWFNDNEFYVNLGSIDAKDSPNKLPQHDLSSFNIEELTTDKLAESDYKGGVGFYSLEYDTSTQNLYFLQTTNFVTTDFYRYKDETLTKIATVDSLVRFYSADNNQLVIQNNKDQLMINDPAEDFAGQKPLLTTSAENVTRPHHIGDKLTYLSGDLFRYAAYQWSNQKIQSLRLVGFTPLLLSNFNKQFVFVAERADLYQIYLMDEAKKPVQISQFKKREYISDIDAKDDIFIVSFRGKIEIYRFDHKRLELIKSLTNYTNGVLSADGKNLLVTKIEEGTEMSQTIEISMGDFKPTGLMLSKAKFAFYYQQQVIYLNHKNELMSLVGSKAKVIAKNIKTESLATVSMYQNNFYYIDTETNSPNIASVNLTNGERKQANIDVVKPALLEVIDNKLTIVAWQSLQPKIIMSTINRH